MRQYLISHYAVEYKKNVLALSKLSKIQQITAITNPFPAARNWLF